MCETINSDLSKQYENSCTLGLLLKLIRRELFFVYAYVHQLVCPPVELKHKLNLTFRRIINQGSDNNFKAQSIYIPITNTKINYVL